ncbi:uncharacterized protein AMSG_03450 [Thecamonas trahens ATCC 50062]|uniref:Uncharacterized protein n=1 Tax=Thecamonas trahens ATCC 50062 TaxID=461836 RepID=A0A0L0D4K1_THETB|nr:hypothetical protein AMSG_03450 [Thecamonas trahens ATCC 50062]KNC47026.1 hypothetical protein AMSG_03450 [Thecamonas trahens ATCC 50062]|eukprot:XP_013759806.1 hypothetical protein AMSG_03450 [Thecamonas trahens ATCC 50062]
MSLPKTTALSSLALLVVVAILATPTALATATDVALVSPMATGTTTTTNTAPMLLRSGGADKAWSLWHKMDGLSAAYSLATQQTTVLVLGKETTSGNTVVMASTDGGSSFAAEPLFSLSPQPAAPFFMAWSSASDRIWLTAGHADPLPVPQLWMSSDGGKDFVAESVLPGLEYNATTHPLASYGRAVFGQYNTSRGAMVVRYYIGEGSSATNDALAVTADGGESWQLVDLALPALGATFARSFDTQLAVGDDTIVVSSAYRAADDSASVVCYVADLFAALESATPWISKSWQTLLPCAAASGGTATTTLVLPPNESATLSRASVDGTRLLTMLPSPGSGGALSNADWSEWTLVHTPIAGAPMVPIKLESTYVGFASTGTGCELYASNYVGGTLFAPKRVFGGVSGVSECHFRGIYTDIIEREVDARVAALPDEQVAGNVRAATPSPPPPRMVGDWLGVGTRASSYEPVVFQMKLAAPVGKDKKPPPADAVPSIDWVHQVAQIDVNCPGCRAEPYAVSSADGHIAVVADNTVYGSHDGGYAMQLELDQQFCWQLGKLVVADTTASAKASVLYASCAVPEGSTRAPFFFRAQFGSAALGSVLWTLMTVPNGLVDGVLSVEDIVFGEGPGHTANGLLLAACGIDTAPVACFYKTADSGTSWEAYTPPVFVDSRVSTVAVAGTTSVYAVYLSETPKSPQTPFIMHDVFATGASSIALPLSSAVTVPAVEMLYGTAIVLAYNGASSGDDLELHVSSDSGATWAPFNLPLSTTAKAGVVFAAVPNVGAYGTQYLLVTSSTVAGTMYLAPTAALADHPDKVPWSQAAGAPNYRITSLFPLADGFPPAPARRSPSKPALSVGAIFAIVFVVISAVGGAIAYIVKRRKGPTGGSINYTSF